MRRRREFMFLGASIVSGLLFYLALLGESGLWRQRELQIDARRLEQAVAVLKQENAVLFARLNGSGPRSVAGRTGADMWIMKFEGSASRRTAGAGDVGGGVTLGEARILFGVGFVLFVLVGVYFTASRSATRRDVHSQGDLLQ